MLVYACDRICQQPPKASKQAATMNLTLSPVTSRKLTFLPRLRCIENVVKRRQRANIVFELSGHHVVVAYEFLITHYSKPLATNLLRFFIMCNATCPITRVAHVINEPSMPFSK